MQAVHGRVEALKRFFGLINLLATRLSKLEPGEMEGLQAMFEGTL